MDNLFSLNRRTALITGASRGIGEMIAAGFVAYGARVYLCARDIDACERTAQEFRAQGAQCRALAGDASTIGGIAVIAQAYRAEVQVYAAGDGFGRTVFVDQSLYSVSN